MKTSTRLAIALASIAVVGGFLSLSFLGPEGLSEKAAKNTQTMNTQVPARTLTTQTVCDGKVKFVTLGREPSDINPGGNCQVVFSVVNGCVIFDGRRSPTDKPVCKDATFGDKLGRLTTARAVNEKGEPSSEAGLDVMLCETDAKYKGWHCL